MDGLLAGVGGKFLSKYMGQYGQPAANIAVGIYRNNNTLTTLGAMQAGQVLASMLPFIGNGNGGGGGLFS
jgi:hypothetical protein